MFSLKILFMYLGESTSGGEQREREKQTLAEQGAQCKAWSQDPVMT